MRKRIVPFFIVVFFGIMVAASLPMPRASACTLWAAAGERVVGGGTLIAKNRDWVPDHQQFIRLNIPTEGYRYIELNTVGNKTPGTKAGINEHGLVVVNASPPGIYDKPENYFGRQGTAWVLRHYRNVGEVLAGLNAGKWAGGPMYLIVADLHEVAVIEFGLNGRNRNESTASGVLYHTNHYMNPDFQYLNPYRSGNSYDRSEHIKAKMARKKSFSIQDFINESIHPTIWRPGASVQSARTLSTWIVSQSPNDEARLYLRMGNPGNPAKEYDFLVKDLFDGKIDLSIVK